MERVSAQTPPSNFVWTCGTTEEEVQESAQTAFPESPICTDPSAVKYIRVAFHFIRAEHFFIRQVDDDCLVNPPVIITYIGYGNFTANSDGNGDLTYNGYQRAEDIVAKANEELAQNQKQWRETPGVSYPATAPPNPLRYVLTGVYFHANDVAFDSAFSTAAIHGAYDVGGDEVLDVYCINNKYEKWNGQGLGGSSTHKYVFLNDYFIYLRPNCREWSKQFSGSSLNHEIGHSLSLSHTWDQTDGCDDTPYGYVYDQVTSSGGCLQNQFANCWKYDPGVPGCPKKPCDEWPKVSNNIMDYNQYYYHAYTQCQLVRIHNDLISNGNTYIHSCNGCAPSNAFFDIRDPVKVCPEQSTPNVWLEGQACHNENRYLIEICAVNDAAPDDCVSGYWNSGWQSGTVGRINLATLYNFSPNRTYRISLEVDNTDCPGSHKYVRLLHTESCDVPVPPCCIGLSVAPNPFSSELTIYWEAPEEATLSFSLVHLFTNQITPLRGASPTPVGPQQQTWSTNALPSGNYVLHTWYAGQHYSQNLVKL